jgi:hypothetical protein
MRIGKGFFGALALTAFIPLSAFSATSLNYTSSPSSWVGGGQTVEVDPSMGFAFNVQRNFDHGVSFAINDFASNPDFQATRWWYLDFAAPLGATLAPGVYDGATRFPFQGANAGLSFDGNGRGDNQLTGSFDVLSVAYDAAGNVLSFDATFTQFDENDPAWWNTGEIRYNVASVPEPTTYALLCAGLILVGLMARSRRRI